MLDVKNTSGTLDKITAFGAGAKRAWTYPNNLIEAQKRILASRHSESKQVVEALKRGQFELAVVTAPGAQVHANISAHLAKSLPKIPFVPLPWLP